MEKYELVEQRTVVAERKAQSLLELRDLGQLARERSQASIRHRASSRADGRSSVQAMPVDDIYEKIDHLQIQIDRVDSKLVEIREDQMKASIDPRPLISE